MIPATTKGWGHVYKACQCRPADADAVTELALRGWGDGDDWQEVWELRAVSRTFRTAIWSQDIWRAWYRRLSRNVVHVPPAIRELLAPPADLNKVRTRHSQRLCRIRRDCGQPFRADEQRPLCAGRSEAMPPGASASAHPRVPAL